MFEKIHIYITILTALVFSIISIVTKVSFFDAILRLIILIILSFTFSLLLKIYLEKNIFLKNQEDKDDNINNTNFDSINDVTRLVNNDINMKNVDNLSSNNIDDSTNLSNNDDNIDRVDSTSNDSISSDNSID